MAKERLTENKAEQTPTGGVLVGKRNGQTMIHNKGSLSGYLVGKTHAQGGIEAVNEATGQPLEMQGGEVVITAPAVSDQTKREFEGKMMTNREILSEINSRGGGVSFAEGGDIPKSLKYTGATYKYGGKTMSDHDIYMHINGGHLGKGKTLNQIAKLHGTTLFDINKQVKMGLKAESEHTSSKREQLKIVKDHLVENPEYYTLLKKAGLKDGGGVGLEKNKINWLKNIGDEGWSSTMEGKNAYENIGGYVSESENWNIYREGRFYYNKYEGFEDFIRDGHWLVYNKDVLYGEFNSLKEAKEYVENWIKINPKDFANGGQVKEDLAKDSEKGDTPARDLNNYNDLLDVSADGAVGGDNGLAFANGGELSEIDTYFDLGGGVGLPKVAYVKVIKVGDYFDKNLIGNTYRSYIEFVESVEDSYKETVKKYAPTPVRTYVTIEAFDEDDLSLSSYSTYISNQKNTVKNFNPSTGNYRNLEKSLSDARPVTFKKYNWEDWLTSKVKPSMPSTATGQTNTQALAQALTSNNIVDTINIKYEEPKSGVEAEVLVSNVAGFLLELNRLRKAGVRKVDFKLSVNGKVLSGTNYGLFLTDDDSDDWKKLGSVVMNPNPIVTSLDTILMRLIDEYPNFDFSKFAGSIPIKSQSTQPQPTQQQSTSGKFTQGEIEMFKDIQNYANDNDLNVTNTSFILGGRAVLVDFINNENGEVYGLVRFESYLGCQKYDKKSQDILKKYLEWEKDRTNLGVPSTQPQSTQQQSTSGLVEIPDEISIKNNSILVGELPKAILALALIRGIDQDIDPKTFDLQDKLTRVTNDKGRVLTFSETPEGFDFWAQIAKGDFREFKKKYGIYGEKIKDITPTASQPQPQSNLLTDLSGTKIWIGNNPDLSRKVQERAFELGWSWITGVKDVLFTYEPFLWFSDSKGSKNIYAGTSKEEFDKNSFVEIFASDLFGSTTASQPTQPSQTNIPESPQQKLENEFVADDFQLRKNDLLGSGSLQQDRNDLDALAKLLPAFQESKFAVEKASIVKEMFRIQKKIDYKGFIASNEEVSKGADLFTPQGLLQYYYTQTTQNPTAELQPACELPTPNGAKSKLPMSAYLNVRSSQFKKWFGDWEKAYETDNYNGCSKMIDEETKEPKIFFHGVRKYIPSFGQMSNMGSGVVRPYGSFEPPNFPASYFADNESYANFYGGIAENMPKPSPDYKPFIYKVFLNIKNPISLLPLDFELSYRDLIDYVLVAYGVRLSVNNVLLGQLENDMDKKHPMWIYIRRDIGLIETLKDYGYDALIQQGDIPVFDKNGQVVSDRSKFIKDTEYLSFYPDQVKSATVKKSFYFNFFNDIRFKKGGYVRI